MEIATWKHNDSIVKSWLYDTLSLPLLHLIFKKQTLTDEVWETIVKVFRDNKNNKVIQVDNELQNITIGDSFMVDYCNHVQDLAYLLENMDAKVPKLNLVSYMLNGLSTKYHHITITIKHQRHVPSFWDTRSMLVLEDQQLVQDENDTASITP